MPCLSFPPCRFPKINEKYLSDFLRIRSFSKKYYSYQRGTRTASMLAVTLWQRYNSSRSSRSHEWRHCQYTFSSLRDQDLWENISSLCDQNVSSPCDQNVYRHIFVTLWTKCVATAIFWSPSRHSCDQNV